MVGRSSWLEMHQAKLSSVDKDRPNEMDRTQNTQLYSLRSLKSKST